MLGLKFDNKTDRPLRVLCIGAHSDDLEIGCGGTMLRLIRENRDLEVYWLVLGSSGERDLEAAASAQDILSEATKKTIVVEHFRDGFFPYHGAEIKDYFERLKKWFTPDLIFTHYRHDLHQDHRLVSELTWNTYRDHLILEYEIVKYDADLGHPNLFVHLDRRTCSAKVSLLMRHFKSQAQHRWFCEDTFWGILRLRGVESNAPEDHAEAFHCKKATL